MHYLGAINNEESSQQRDMSYYRQSVHQFNLIGKSKEFDESVGSKNAQDLLEKRLLTRTLSDSKIQTLKDIDDNTLDFYKTLPSNINKRKVSFDNGIFEF